MGGAQGVRALLMIGTTIVASRILSPSDYGVLAMWAPILAFVLLFQNLGFSAATIQAQKISPEQSTTLFWLNVAASILIASLLIAMSPVVSAFYGDERVGSVTAASAGMVVLSSLAIQHTALLTREMRYRELAAIIVATGIADTSATIILSLHLRSYWALFLGTLAGTTAQLVLTWLRSSWRPGKRASWEQTRALIGFGGYVAAFDLLNFVNRNADNILIGRVWGASPLGLYERSQKLMLAPLQLVNAPLGRVVLPVLSRLRGEPAQYRAAYLFNLRALLLVTVPAAALAASASEPLILLLLGPAWREAATIFFWLALATLYQPLANSTGWLFLSSGRAKAYAAWGLASSVVIMSSFVIGVRWGPKGVAMAYVIGGLVRMPFLLHWAPRDTPVRTSDFGQAITPFAVGGVCTWLAVSVLDRFLPPLPLIALGLIVSYSLTLAALAAFPHGRNFLRDLSRLIRSMLRGRALSGVSRSVLADGLSYLSEAKIKRIETALEEVKSVPGCTAEFGVALGGSAIVIATLASDRNFHGFDVFGMIPEPTSAKDDQKSKARFDAIRSGASKGIGGQVYYGYRANLFSEVQASFARHGVPVDGLRVRLHRGLFEETVPVAPMDRLAFVHIDCDWYDPVRYCLETAANLMSNGGVIVIDDYYDYGGCRTAVDEFLAERSDFTFEDGPNPILRRS